MPSFGPPRTYPPVGVCIYCGASKGALTNEHIIPYGLGGTWVLPRASCEPCARITRDVEQLCLRPMLGPLRIRLQLPTRRPKERPTELPIDYIQPDGTRDSRMLPAGNFPLFCLGFKWPAPALLCGLPLTERFEGKVVVRFIEGEVDEHTKLAGRRVKLGTFNMQIFARMLAKIAHSYAVANVGLSGFNPLLPDVILGKSEAAPWLIGGDTSEPPAAESSLHQVYVQHCLTDGRLYLLATLRLFAFMGMPQYHVVVGPINARAAI